MRSGLPGRWRVRAFLASVASIAVTAGLLVAVSQPASASVGTTVDTVSTDAAASADVAAETATVDAVVDTDVVKTADLSAFDAGNIISDAVFFDSSTMSASQIQSFLESKVPSCQSGYTCLKDAYDTSRSTSADAMCAAYSGGYSEKASTIIYKVAKACGINPQVLLVMLQKEQGLVTHTWPSDWRYTIAMGQGCPDTAACDTKYYGFFNQVYGAARQMKIYTVYPTSFTYRAAQNNSIYWHPNSSCGTSTVYIRNQATANLYIYTPYRPNQAALNAGYGTGDSCSSYGNRNFYNYFTDWFGSTQGSISGLINNDGDIYIASGSRRYHISRAMLSTYTAVFGDPIAVSSSQLTSWTMAGEATAIVRNSSTGEVALLQDGERHWFDSCTLVASWGGTCNSSEVILSNSDFEDVGEGEDMTRFARASSSGSILLIDDGVLAPVYDDETAALLNSGDAPYAAVMDSTTRATYSVGNVVRFAPANFVRTTDSTRVYLPNAEGTLHYLSDWDLAEELGMPGTTYRSVDPSVLSGYRDDTDVSLVVVCGTNLGFAAGGTIYPVSQLAVTGIEKTSLDDATCDALTWSDASQLDRVYVQGEGESEVYVASNGVYRHVTSQSVLKALGGGTKPTILQLSADTVASLPKGDPVTSASDVPEIPGGAMVRSSSSSRTYMTTADGRAIYLPSWDLAAEWGFPTRVVTTLTDAQFATLTLDGTLDLFVSCDDATFYMADGTLRPVAEDAADGFDAPVLDAQTCAMFEAAEDEALSRVFVQGTGTSEVYLAVDGVYRHVTSQSVLKALNGGPKPTVVALNAATIADLMLGDEISSPPVGVMVRSASSNKTYLTLSSSTATYLPSWALASEWGYPARFVTVLDDVTFSLLEPEGELGSFVSCQGSTWYAAGGVLHEVSEGVAEGFDATEVSDAICDELRLSSDAALTQLFVQGTGRAEVYMADDGEYRHVTSQALLKLLGGGQKPTILAVSAGTVDGLAKGDDALPPIAAMVRSTSSSRTYMTDAGSRAVYLPSWTLAAEWGFPTRVVSTLPDATIDALTLEDELGLFAACGSQTWYASRGTLHRIDADSASGFAVTMLDEQTCAQFEQSEDAELPAVFVQGVGQSEVYMAVDGVYRHVTSQAVLKSLGGGAKPTILQLSADMISLLPKGEPLS